MNRKIPYHELATMLAGHCNITPAEAENFIKSFFDRLTLSLTEGETVKIKGIGTFAPTGDADMPVSFSPDSEIADTINAPFAMFEPEEVSDSLSDDAFSQLDAAEEHDSEQSESEELIPQEATTTQECQDSQDTTSTPVEPITEVESVTAAEATQPAATEYVAEPIISEEVATETIAEPESEPEHSAEPVEAPQTTPEPIVEPDVATPQDTEIAPKEQPESKTVAPTPVVPVKPTAKPVTPATPTVTSKTTPAFPDEEPEEYYREPEQKSGAGFGWGFIIGMLVGLALGACGVYFAIDYIFPTMPQTQHNAIEEAELINEIQFDSVAAPLADDSVKATTASVATITDTIKPAETQTAPLVKDTVRPGYLLNDMAKKHYGNKCFWVYIYEENKAKIANPNRVGPGLELVIPPAEKYGIDSSSQASIKAANEKAGKILTKYPK